MTVHTLTSAADLEPLLTDMVVIGFFGDFSAAAKAALPAFQAFAEQAELPVAIIDVGAVKGVHKRFGVTTVPAAVTWSDGAVIRRAVGAHTAEGWAKALVPHKGAAPAAADVADGPRFPPVTVYSTPTCSWCTRIKRYFDEQGVPYRDVDVSKDPAIAEALVQRSGQRGVPQTDIGGQIVVGFDKPRIDKLLGLSG